MSHLSYEQRYSIEVLLRDKKSKSEVAKLLEVNKTVIYREIKRNSDERNGVYKASLAQSKYEKRLFLKPKYKTGGMVSSASKRADGCAVKGKTKGRIM
jgi:IS30 family transposase